MAAPPPPPPVLFGVFLFIGTLFSFLLGRTPGTLPDNLMSELALPVSVICVFIVLYNLLDAMAAGIAKAKHKLHEVSFTDRPATLPEEVLLAEAVQRNQVEQMPGFIMATLLFSVFVNGRAGGVFGLWWAVLRRLYARKYRSSVGVPFSKAGLTTLTVPCYFLVNSMLLGTMVHMVRYLLS